MKKETVLELRDVYGGDGEVRKETRKETKLKRTKKKTETRADIGIQVGGGETSEENVEEIETEIQTFRRDEDGDYILRLGGSHGKIYGALKESASALRTMGEAPFRSGYMNILRSIMIQPVWCKLKMEDGGKTKVEELPQILAGFKKTMIVQKFDVIPKCQTKIIVSYPDVMDDAVNKMVKNLENIALLNKRRATCKIIAMKPVKT